MIPSLLTFIVYTQFSLYNNIINQEREMFIYDEYSKYFGYCMQFGGMCKIRPIA